MARRRKFEKDSQEILPAVRDYKAERIRAVSQRVDQLMSFWNSGLSGEAVWAAQCLITCGLPITESREAHVVRKCRLSNGSWIRVTFYQSNPGIPLPSRQDRNMMHFLTHKAVTSKSPVFRWNCVNEYIRLFDLAEHSGENNRTVQERFIRVAYMDILIEILDPIEKVVEQHKVPLVQATRLNAEIDGEGNWRVPETPAKMLAKMEVVGISPSFYEKFLRKPIPIPLELLKTTYKAPRIQDYAIFIYWRAFTADDVSTIPMAHLQQQFDNRDTNPARWVQYFKKAITILRALPHPFSLIEATVTSEHLKIHPLPRGTAFFEGQVKKNGPLVLINSPA